MNAINESYDRRQEDEIDLIDLIIGIWRGKGIILASTIFATIIGVGYYFMSPAQFQVNVDLQASSKTEVTWFYEVSMLPGVNLNEDNVVSFYTNHIKDEQFIEQFSDSYFANQLEKFELENPNEVVNIKYEFSLLDVNANSGSRPIGGAKLTFSSSKLSTSELKGFIKAFLAHIQKTTKSSVIEYIQQKSEQYQDRIHTQIATINLQKQIIASQSQEQLVIDIVQIDEKITEVKAKTEAYLETRIRELKNQIIIAKKLNIERPSPAQDEGFVFNIIKTGTTPLFMQGYIALEEELTFIENRTSLDYFSKELRDLKVEKTILESRDKEVIFDPEIVKLNGQLLKLKNDIAITNYSTFLNEGNLALFTPQIMKVTSSFNAKDFITKTSPRKLIIILAIFAGGFIGIVLVFMLSITRAVQNKLKLEKS